MIIDNDSLKRKCFKCTKELNMNEFIYCMNCELKERGGKYMECNTEQIEKLIHQILDRYAKENELRITLNSDYDKGIIKIKVYE